MSDYISRQAAIDAIRASTSKYTGFMEMEMYTDDDAVEAINGVPPAQKCMTATSNTMMSETVKIPVMDGTTERLPTSDVMDDLIKRQDAITEYCEHECGIKGMTRENCGATDCGTIFDDIPSAQQWIPCSERLPEEYVDVLVWFEYYRFGEYNRMYSTYGIGDYDAEYDKWWINHESGWRDLHVFAWMPLPEPYKGEEL